MENTIKTYKTTSDKTPSRVFQAFGPWLCVSESKTRLRDEEGNWLNEWQITEEWQYNSEGWSEEIYESGMKNKKPLVKKMFCQMREGQESQVIYDYQRGVKWRQFINEHGTHMTVVTCLKTAWSVESNIHSFGSLTDEDLDKLVTHLMQSVPKE